MKNNAIFVPDKIKVGYQYRNDTYTGKLAYITRYDETGKLRAEKSWNDWRDLSIKPEEFENVPTSGFVINKKVGDHSSGWDHRHAWCRIYDPRGFEFEITFDNLLYILEHTSCLKGKGLEGEFVYGWSGKDLILMPTCSSDYHEIQEYSKKISTNDFIGAKDLKVGGIYLDKKRMPHVYVGKFRKYKKVHIVDGKEFEHSWDLTNSCNSSRHTPLYVDRSNIYYDGSYDKIYAADETIIADKGVQFVFASLISKSNYNSIEIADINDTANVNIYFEWSKNTNKKFIECVGEVKPDTIKWIMQQIELEPEYSPVNLDDFRYEDMPFNDFNHTISSRIKLFSLKDHTKSYNDKDKFALKVISSWADATKTVVCDISDAEKLGFKVENGKVVPIPIKDAYEMLKPIEPVYYQQNGIKCKYQW